MNWSDEQEAIFAWFERGEGHAIIRARAGTGKTTVVLEGVRRAPERRVLVAAFGKSIADELKAKNQSHAEVATLHSLGNRFIRLAAPHATLDGNYGREIANRVMSRISASRLAAPYSRTVEELIAKCAAYAKNVAPLACDRKTVVGFMHEFDDLELTHEDRRKGWTEEEVADRVMGAIDKAAAFDEQKHDFDDMLWLPLVKEWTRPLYGLIVIDEAQDMCAAQIILAKRSLAEGGRIAVVGDEKQAIYGFRGADIHSMKRLHAELCATVFPLTLTYRCAQKVVARAQKLVSDIRALPDARPGVVRSTSSAKLPQELQTTDLILSRTNAALVGAYLRAARERKNLAIRMMKTTDEVAKSLIDLLKKVAKHATCVHEILDPLAEDIVEIGATIRQLEEDRSPKNPRRVELKRLERNLDRYKTLEFFAQDLCENATGPAPIIQLTETIRGVFASPWRADESVTFSTIHGAKGFEAPRVFVLAKTLYITGNLQDEEEQNLEYVAITRAKHELVFVDGAAPAATEPPVLFPWLDFVEEE